MKYCSITMRDRDVSIYGYDSLEWFPEQSTLEFRTNGKIDGVATEVLSWAECEIPDKKPKKWRFW